MVNPLREHFTSHVSIDQRETCDDPDRQVLLRLHQDAINRVESSERAWTQRKDDLAKALSDQRWPTDNLALPGVLTHGAERLETLMGEYVTAMQERDALHRALARLDRDNASAATA